MSHTPGPWSVCPSVMRGMPATIAVVGSTPHTSLAIAHVDQVDGYCGNADGASHANARLIAAAPDAYELLSEAHERFATLDDADEATEADLALYKRIGDWLGTVDGRATAQERAS